jgi:hypothetical protein
MTPKAVLSVRAIQPLTLTSRQIATPHQNEMKQSIKLLEGEGPHIIGRGKKEGEPEGNDNNCHYDDFHYRYVSKNWLKIAFSSSGLVWYRWSMAPNSL